jgi:hypothetical protein
MQADTNVSKKNVPSIFKKNVIAVNMQPGCKEGAHSDPQEVKSSCRNSWPTGTVNRKFKKQGPFFFSQFHVPPAT